MVVSVWLTVHDILTSVAFWKGVKELLVVSKSVVCLLR
jgi:hypothetical protein